MHSGLSPTLLIRLKYDVKHEEPIAKLGDGAGQHKKREEREQREASKFIVCSINAVGERI